MGLEIKTKKIFELSFNGVAIAGETLLEELQFNLNGDVQKSVNYDESGEIISILETEFKGGKPGQCKTTDYDQGTEHILEYAYENGKLIKQIERYNESEFVETNFEYGPDGRLSREYIRDNEGNSQGKTEYEYSNSEGHLIERHYNEDGQLEEEHHIMSDAEGHEVETRVRRFYESFHVDIVTTRVISENGNLLSAETYREGNCIYRLQNDFDESGKYTKRVVQDLERGQETVLLFIRNNTERSERVETYLNNQLKEITVSTKDENGEVTQKIVYAKVDDEHVPTHGQRYELTYQ